MKNKNVVLAVAAIIAVTGINAEAKARRVNNGPIASAFTCPDISGSYKSQKSGNEVQVTAQLGDITTYSIGTTLEIIADGSEHNLVGSNSQAGVTYIATCTPESISIEFKKEGKAVGNGTVTIDTDSNLHININAPTVWKDASEDLIKQTGTNVTPPTTQQGGVAPGQQPGTQQGGGKPGTDQGTNQGNEDEDSEDEDSEDEDSEDEDSEDEDSEDEDSDDEDSEDEDSDDEDSEDEDSDDEDSDEE